MNERNYPVQFSMTAEEKAELNMLAESQGRSVASMLRWLVKKEAKKVLENKSDG